MFVMINVGRVGSGHPQIAQLRKIVADIAAHPQTHHCMMPAAASRFTQRAAMQNVSLMRCREQLQNTCSGRSGLRNMFAVFRNMFAVFRNIFAVFRNISKYIISFAS